jgi:hypothetical protein
MARLVGVGSADNEDPLRDAKTQMPDTFDNHRADNWRVMLAIADLAGEDWGDKARLAATRLEGASEPISGPRSGSGAALASARPQGA